jgi:hypothetical protein
MLLRRGLSITVSPTLHFTFWNFERFVMVVVPDRGGYRSRFLPHSSHSPGCG